MYTSTNEASAPVNNIFQTTLLRNAKARCPYFTGSTPAEITEHNGTFTAKWRRVENLTPVTTALSELTGSVSFPTREAVRPSVTDFTAAVQKYGNFIFLNEEVDLVNFNGQTDKLVEIIGINAGQSLNRLQRNEVEDNSTLKYTGTATADGNVISIATLSDFKHLGNLLDRASALKYTAMTMGSQNVNTTPIRDAYWAISHSDVEQDVRAQTGFVPVEQYAAQTEIERGEFGTLQGIRFISTPEASIDADSGGAATATGVTRYTTGTANIDLYNTVVFGQDHHGSVGFGFEHIKETYMAGDALPGVMLISHEKGSAGSADPLNEVATLGWKSWHAPKVLTNSSSPTTGEWGYCLRSGASILAID